MTGHAPLIPHPLQRFEDVVVAHYPKATIAVREQPAAQSCDGPQTLQQPQRLCGQRHDVRFGHLHALFGNAPDPFFPTDLRPQATNQFSSSQKGKSQQLHGDPSKDVPAVITHLMEQFRHLNDRDTREVLLYRFTEDALGLHSRRWIQYVLVQVSVVHPPTRRFDEQSAGFDVRYHGRHARQPLVGGLSNLCV